MSKKVAIIALITSLHNPYVIQANTFSNIENGVIKITTYKNGDESKKGAGIVIGKGSNEIFILTAHHILFFEPDSSLVDSSEIVLYSRHLFRGNLAQYNYHYNESLDVGIITLKIESKEFDTIKDDFPTFVLAQQDTLTTNEKVTVIGHLTDEEWVKVTVNEILTTSFEDDVQKFTFTPIAIQRGYSGGPVFDKEQNLIGVVLRVGSSQGVATEITTVLKWLKARRIPTNLIRRGGSDESDTLARSALIRRGGSLVPDESDTLAHSAKRATLLSSLFPSLGQYYKRDIWRGTGILLGVIVSSRWVLLSHQSYRNKNNAYKKSVQEYQNIWETELGISSFYTVEATMLKNYEDAQRYYDNRSGGIALLGAFWFYSIMDALVRSPNINQAYLSLDADMNIPQIVFTWNF